MKTVLFLWLTGIIFLITASSFKPDNSAPMDNYYYYKGSQIPLFKSNTDLFIALKNPMTADEFSSSLGTDRAYFEMSNFNPNEQMQIVKFTSMQPDESAESLIRSLRSNPSFETASTVFTLPSNVGSSKVQLGCINEIIVQFKSGMSSAEALNYIESNSFQVINKLDLSGGESYILKVPAENNSLDVANDIFESGMVNYSEPNFFQTNLLCYTPNDAFFGSQWSIKNTGSNAPTLGGVTADCDMDVDSAWDISLGSSSVQVSVVDTGIDTLHPDLSAKIVNGKGYNFYSNNTNSMDDNNHGTCCSGIIGASGNNTIGISGVAPNARIFGIKIFNASGSTTSAAITNGLIYTKTSGCWVSSNSWGGGSPISAADNAILDGVTTGRGGKGIVYCFATGNDNSSVSWPATLTNVIAVGGISPCNQRKSPTSCDGENWWGANYGTGLTIVAPCVKIYATDRRGSAGYSSTDYFSTFNGTSSATPNTSGVCALALGLDSNMRWDTLRSRVARLADKVGSYTYSLPGSLSLGGWNNEMGYGRINAYRVLKYTQEQMVVPPVPANITAVPEGFYNTLTGRLNMKDTVRVYLRNSTPPFAKVDSGKARIDSVNFTASILFSNAPSGTYYLVLNHRNSIETWSKFGGESYISGNVLNYDFTSDNSQSYGNNMVLVGPEWSIYSGDVDKSGTITLSDILNVFNDVGIFSSGYIQSDLNGDKFATLSDILIAYNNATKFVVAITP
ncbi:MAG: S8 family serine peptidase [Ignavibacteria bacterium]